MTSWSQSAELRSASLTRWSDLIWSDQQNTRHKSEFYSGTLSASMLLADSSLARCPWAGPDLHLHLNGQILEVLSSLWGGLSPSLFKRCSFFLFLFFWKPTADFSVLCFAESHRSSQLSRSAERTSSFEIFHFPLCCQAPCWWVTPRVWPIVSWT